MLQGGILSPHLFNLYIDDLAMTLVNRLHLKAYLYADDLGILINGKIELKKTLKAVENRAKGNKMMLNKKKCGIMNGIK